MWLRLLSLHLWSRLLRSALSLGAAMDSRARELLKRSNKLFDARSTILSLWQVLAENFYPERADFTASRNMGDEFASHLFATDPVLMRRDLGNAFSSMLRPRGRLWFKRDVDDDKLREEANVDAWLEWSTAKLRRALYQVMAQFVRATKEADHDFAAFGNAVLSCEVNQELSGLRYRAYHLRTCAWAENHCGDIDTLFRDLESFTARQIAQYFKEPGDTLHREVIQALEKEPDKVFKVRHCMLPAADYDYSSDEKQRMGAKLPYASVYIDVDNQHIIRSAGAHEFRYVVPRWQTISGSAYAVSPAAIVALPDARMMQALARIIQEAGEKSIDPPLKATEEAVRGQINLYASGVTWVDRDYDEKDGPAIEPIQLGKDAGLGVHLFDRIQLVLQNAWYLNKLNLPQQGDRTAFETAQLVEEFIRAAVPLFEPAETEYNAKLLDLTDRVMIRMGAYGTPDDLPQALYGKDITFSFSNPLQDAVEKAKVMQFQTMTGITAAAAQFDPAAVAQVDWVEATRDSVRGAGAPANWLKSKEDADAAVEAVRQEQQMAKVIQGAGAGGQAAEAVGKGVQALTAPVGQPQQVKKAA